MTRIHDIAINEAAFFPEPPPYWRDISDMLGWETTKAWENNGLFVLATAGIYGDGKEWLHVSFSRKSRIPDYGDLQRVKRDFFGPDKKAVMVFPAEAEYVDIHKNCLHMFYSAENPLPEFGGGLTI